MLFGMVFERGVKRNENINQNTLYEVENAGKVEIVISKRG